jgi:hypothetical protein
MAPIRIFEVPWRGEQIFLVWGAQMAKPQSDLIVDTEPWLPHWLLAAETT